MTSLRIASWNINSVRLRIRHIQTLVETARPDILCLQETKTEDSLFPLELLKSYGFEHLLYCGQKSYNGVAIASRLPLTPLPIMDVLDNGSCRHIAAIVGECFTLHNFYIPAGGDIPDVTVNPKFKEKLHFVDYATRWSPSVKEEKTIVLGDFNIAPYEHDVWSHKQLLDVVSHTPIEVEKLNAFRDAGNWVDTGRFFTPADQKLYSWWSYRSRDWKVSNRGRRLDHIWVTQSLKPYLKDYQTLVDARDWQQPSDHVPIMTTLEIV